MRPSARCAAGGRALCGARGWLRRAGGASSPFQLDEVEWISVRIGEVRDAGSLVGNAREFDPLRRERRRDGVEVVDRESDLHVAWMIDERLFSARMETDLDAVRV